MALAPGTRLGPYEVIGPLGSGGMGEVYRARDTRLDREVAIKVRPAHLSGDPNLRKRLEREARAASALSHPNICAVYDVGEEHGCYFIAMELIDGRTLSRIIDGQPMLLQEVLRLGIQVADALEAAHKRAIVHRDLKPANILVTKRGDAKVLDFGLAKQLGIGENADATATTQIVLTAREEVLGTVPYMSPEQARGEEVDTRSDIFSFGAVLYEMSTGRRAFEGGTSATIFAEILRGEPIPLQDLNPTYPVELQRVIDKTLEKDRAERYQSANELMIDLRRLNRQLFDSSARNTVRRGQPRSYSWLKKATAVSLGVLALVVLAIALTSAPTVKGLLDSKQITFSTESKAPPLLTDGTRLYFQSDRGPVEMSVNGGAIAPLRSSMAGMRMLDVSRDGSELLVTKPSINDEDFRGSLWSVPVLGGSPKRIGNELVTAGRWLPDGHSLIFMQRRSVFICDLDGANSRKIWEAPGNVVDPSFSQDGRRIRVTVKEGEHARIWELNMDGSNAHPLSLKWLPGSDVSSGRWTPDGRHFVFQSDADGSNNIYELIEPDWLEFWKSPSAVKLTSGELEILDSIPSRDSQQLFVLGRVSQGTMQVYDPHQKKFIPFLGGLGAVEIVISPNRQWMAYTDYPRRFLWISKLDGSERRQLTSSYAVWPRWSPDGRSIVYMDWRAIYMISSEGGTPEKLIGDDDVHEVGPEWTPDGKAISFNDFPKLGLELKGVKVLDLASRKVSLIPGSAGFFVGSWAPDGKYMVAMAQNPLRMMLFNTQAQSWSELKRFDVSWGYWVWAGDSKSILFAQTEGARGIYRLTILNGTWERMADLGGIQVGEGFLSLTADGQPAIMKDTSVIQIYSMKWK